MNNQMNADVKGIDINTVPSPCVRECVVEDNICQGCGRSLEEISQWRLMSDDHKKAVWQRLSQKLSE